jgi:hypothetical protein
MGGGVGFGESSSEKLNKVIVKAISKKHFRISVGF